jgi:5-methylcytosine-specific restriction endonuclease McrA
MAKVTSKNIDRVINGSSEYRQSDRKAILSVHDDEIECAYCGDTIDKDDSHIDHIRPKSRGGTNHAFNMIPVCKSCNLSKGAKGIDEFLKDQGHSKAAITRKKAEIARITKKTYNALKKSKDSDTDSSESSDSSTDDDSGDDSDDDSDDTGNDSDDTEEGSD